MDPSVILESPSRDAERVTGPPPWRFTWGRLHKGDCTMLEGATWTLHPDGSAIFAATVTSVRDGAAWTIWHVDLIDDAGLILGSLRTRHPIGGDARKFVHPVPTRADPHPFHACATFDAGVWPGIASLRMYSSC